MKNILTLLLLVLSISLFAQREKRTDFDYNNRFDINVQFVGLEFDYKHKLFENFNLGIGGFMLTNTSLTGESRENYGEFAKVKLFLEYDQLKSFRFYVGPKLAGVLFWASDTFTYLKAIEIGVFTRGRRIEFGIELSLAQSEGFSADSKRLMTSLLVVKIPISRW